MIASSRDYHAYRSERMPQDLIPIANTNHFTIFVVAATAEQHAHPRRACDGNTGPRRIPAGNSCAGPGGV